MNPINTAIETAKKNPNSDYATELRRRIESGMLDNELSVAGLSQAYNRPEVKRNLLQRVGDNVVEAVKNPAVLLDRLAEQAPDFNLTRDEQGNIVGDREEALESVNTISEFAIGGSNVARPIVSGAIDATRNVAQQGIESLSTNARNLAGGTGDIAVKSRDSIVEFLSPRIDPAFKKMFETTPTEKFDDFVNTGRNAADNVEAPSVFEKVSESMSNATKQLNSQITSLSQQKKSIIEKARTGLASFTKETGDTILALNRQLKNSSVAQTFITKLKQVNTKLDADNAIDELQDILFKGNRDLTIPSGSKEDKVLKVLLGSYNTKLKSTLPKSYADLNLKVSNRIKVINVLNRSLGEVVDGVSTRGAGLVKQFFSPAGTKTKQLFKYIKETTGVDLAQDSVLAKYIGEAFGDTKIKSLLQGLPTTKSGIVDSTIDFVLEKTGANNAISNIKQTGMIGKARRLTLSKQTPPLLPKI